MMRATSGIARVENSVSPRGLDHLPNALDVGNECHVEHAVGFVDHQQFDAGEQQPAAFGMVEQTAGVAIRTSTPRVVGVLVAERNAADQECHVEFLPGACLRTAP